MARVSRLAMAGLQKTVSLKAIRGTYGFLLTGSAPVTVTSVDPRGAAKLCGLSHGDVVLSINGKNVVGSSQAQMVAYLRKHQRKTHKLIVQPVRRCNHSTLFSIVSEPICYRGVHVPVAHPGLVLVVSVCPCDLDGADCLSFKPTTMLLATAQFDSLGLTIGPTRYLSLPKYPQR